MHTHEIRGNERYFNQEKLHLTIGYLTPDETYCNCANVKCYYGEDVLLEVA